MNFNLVVEYLIRSLLMMKSFIIILKKQRESL